MVLPLGDLHLIFGCWFYRNDRLVQVLQLHCLSVIEFHQVGNDNDCQACTKHVDEIWTTSARPRSPSCGHAVTHTQGINKPPITSQLVHYTTTDIANPCAMCAEPTRPADGLQDPLDQLKPLWVVASTKVERETADEDR